MWAAAPHHLHLDHLSPDWSINKSLLFSTFNCRNQFNLYCYGTWCLWREADGKKFWIRLNNTVNFFPFLFLYFSADCFSLFCRKEQKKNCSINFMIVIVLKILVLAIISGCLATTCTLLWTICIFAVCSQCVTSFQWIYLFDSIYINVHVGEQ